MRRAAARGVEVDDTRWIGATPAAVIACQGPEIAGLGSTAAGIEDRRLGLVHEQLARGFQVLGQAVDDRLQVERCLADPIGQHRAAQVDPGPGIDLRLTIERQVVGILGDQHMGDQRLGGQRTFDQVRGCRGLHDGAGAAAAGIFRPDGHDDPEPGGGDVEPLTAVFPDPGHLPAAARAKRAFRLEDALEPRQFLWQPAKMAADRDSLGTRSRPCSAVGGLGRLDLRHGGLQVLKGQLSLVRAKPLRLSAMQCLPEFPQQMLEPSILLGKCCKLLLEGATGRALGRDEGLQLG